MKTNVLSILLEEEKATWLMKTIKSNPIQHSKLITLQQLKDDYEETMDDFELFWFSKPVIQLRENGIILLL